MAKLDKHIYPSVHCGIVRAALYLLELENHPSARRFSADDTEIIADEAAAPDRMGDRQQGRGLHYYNAVKPDGTQLPYHPVLCGYANGKGAASPSPLTVLDAEYRTALALETAGKPVPAMKSLSRAMHMLADICCPPHSCSLTYFSRYAMMHKRYEAQAAAIFWEKKTEGLSQADAAAKWARKAVGSVPYETYSGLLRGGMPVKGGAWQGSKFSEICNQLAFDASHELSAVLGSDDTVRAASIERQILRSITNCAALLAAYDSDLQHADAQIWQEQQPYWLKGFRTAISVTKHPLFLHFDDDGTVSLATEEGRYLSVNRVGMVSVTEPAENQIIRFRFGREPLLTLYPNGDQDKLLAMIRGQLYCIRRIPGLQGNLFYSQVQFVLTRKQPENGKYIFDCL